MLYPSLKNVYVLSLFNRSILHSQVQKIPALGAVQVQEREVGKVEQQPCPSNGAVPVTMIAHIWRSYSCYIYVLVCTHTVHVVCSCSGVPDGDVCDEVVMFFMSWGIAVTMLCMILMQTEVDICTSKSCVRRFCSILVMQCM